MSTGADFDAPSNPFLPAFDGDEVSQGRMARAVSSMEDADTVLWVLADNSVIRATKAELREALRLAGSAQAAIWVAT